MRRSRPPVAAILASLLSAWWMTAAVAQTDADGPVQVNECVGPHVTSVIQGDYRHGIPDRAIGDTPPILEAPAGQVVGQLSV